MIAILLVSIKYILYNKNKHMTVRAICPEVF